jgi:Flp pilus assembly protein TadG
MKIGSSAHAFRIFAAQENAGVAAVEFALYSLVFLMVLAATVNIGLMLFTASQLDAAITAGAEYAVNNAAMVASSPSTLNTNVSNIVDNAISTGWATSTVNVNNSSDSTHCYCPTGTPGSWTWGSASSSCDTACPSGTGVYGQFVTITASRSLSPLFPSFGFVPSSVSRSIIFETE